MRRWFRLKNENVVRQYFVHIGHASSQTCKKRCIQSRVGAQTRKRSKRCEPDSSNKCSVIDYPANERSRLFVESTWLPRCDWRNWQNDPHFINNGVFSFEIRNYTLRVAVSQIAATFLEGGQTAHSALKLPIIFPLTDEPICIGLHSTVRGFRGTTKSTLALNNDIYWFI